MNNVKARLNRRGWTTWSAKTATSHDVAPKPPPVEPVPDVVALPVLRADEVYLVAGSSVFHDQRCDRVVAALVAGKTIEVVDLVDVGKRKRCAACAKLDPFTEPDEDAS